MNPTPAVTPLTNSFDTIPPELRNEIYQHLLVSPEPIWISDLFWISYHGSRASRYTTLTNIFSSDRDDIFPAILRVSKKISAEALYVLYGRNTFVVKHYSSPRYPTVLDSSISTASFAAMRSIELQTDLYTACRSQIHISQINITKLCELCPSVRSLTIRVRPQSWVLRSVEEIIYVGHSTAVDCGKIRELYGVSLSQKQWDGFRESCNRAVGTSGETATLVKHLLGIPIEKIVKSLPSLRKLELAGLVENTMGMAAMEILEKRVIEDKDNAKKQ
ncbi:MAG: hypothetical protein M1812_006313 [Candelaria pacifica]|nr:MAG: hypothetical protein M1812_006313 [Candelaria pacifica]